MAMIRPKEPGWITMLQVTTNMKDQIVGKPWHSHWAIWKLLYSFFTALALVPFIESPVTGFFIFLALAWSEPLALAAVASAFAMAFAICTAMNTSKEEIIGGHLIFNSLLLASVATCVLPGHLRINVSLAFWVLLLGTTILTVLVNIGLSNMLMSSKITCIGVPFLIGVTLLSLIMKAAMLNGSNMFSLTDMEGLSVQNRTEALQWTKVLRGTLLSCGQVFGTNDLTSAVLIWIGMTLHSPIAALIIYMCSSIGTMTAIALSSPLQEVYGGLWGFNALLASSGLCCFLEKSPFAVVCAFFAALFSTAIQSGIVPVFAKFDLPVFSIPAHIAIYVFLLGAIHKGSPISFAKDRSTMELNLYFYFYNNKQAETQIQSVEDGTCEPIASTIPEIVVTECNGRVVTSAEINGNSLEGFPHVQSSSSEIIDIGDHNYQKEISEKLR